MPHKTLHAFYDLEVNPTCFDIMKFLVLSDLERRKQGLDGVHILFVPASGDGFRADDFNKDLASKQWRLRQLMVSACPLLPSLSGVTVCSSREEAQHIVSSVAEHIFPLDYTVDTPTVLHNWSDVIVAMIKGERIPILHTPPAALTFAEQWIRTNIPEGKKPVTITMREMDFQEERNSNLKAWSAFAQELQASDDYAPIILRDTAMSFEPVPDALDGLPQFREGTFHMELRSALYERAYTNLMISNGPIEICMLNPKISYAKVKVRVPRTMEIGYPEGGVAYQEQPPLNGPGRIWWWEDDTLENIQRCFTELTRQLEDNGGVPGPACEDGQFPTRDLDPMEIAVRLCLGGSYDQALQIVDSPLFSNSTDHRYFATSGHIHLSKGLLEDAVSNFRKAIALDDGIAQYHHFLAVALEKMEDHAAALEASLRSEEVEPGKYLYAVFTAGSLEKNGRQREAIEAYKRALSLGSDPIVITARVGALHESFGEFEEALKAYQFVHEKLPENPLPLDWMAGAYTALGRPKDAMAARMKAFKIAQDTP